MSHEYKDRDLYEVSVLVTAEPLVGWGGGPQSTTICIQRKQVAVHSGWRVWRRSGGCGGEEGVEERRGGGGGGGGGGVEGVEG